MSCYNIYHFSRFTIINIRSAFMKQSELEVLFTNSTALDINHVFIWSQTARPSFHIFPLTRTKKRVKPAISFSNSIQSLQTINNSRWDNI
jgi:hypothetical protein